MKRRNLKPLAVVAALCGACLMTPAAVQADLALGLDMSEAVLDYTFATGALDVTDSSASVFDLLLNDTDFPFGTLDTARLDAGMSHTWGALVDMDLVRHGMNDYTATGVFSVVDESGIVAMEASFSSTSISLESGTLAIQGNLVGMGGGSILVNKGTNPWIFEGNSVVPGMADGDEFLEVMNAAQYEGGNLTTFRFALGSGTELDDVFNVGDLVLSGGEVKGSIVPAPGAALLGMMGFSMVGWIKRRMS